MLMNIIIDHYKQVQSVQVITSCLTFDHVESAHVGRPYALLYTACDLAFLAWMMARACLSLTMGLIESCAMGAQL